jgi:predicted nucleotidyltransferase component of viral defense system
MSTLKYHKEILTRILYDLVSETGLAEILGFKGGTAVYFFYELPRYSVDLDFDLLQEKFTGENFVLIKNILEKYGEIKDVYEKRYSVLFEISYSDKTQNIKVEINKRNFGSEYEIKYLYGLPLKVMKKEDMFANKLVAMFERECKVNRDIFDVYFFLDKGWEFNDKIIIKRTGFERKEFLLRLLKLLRKKNNARILSGLGDLLEDDLKKWVKLNLLKKTIFLLELKSA